MDELLNMMIAIENYIDDIEADIMLESAYESVMYGEDSIAMEAGILSKIKSAFQKKKKGKNNEATRELEAAQDEYEVQFEEAKSDEEKRKLSKAAKAGIAVGIAALIAGAALALKKGRTADAKTMKDSAKKNLKVVEAEIITPDKMTTVTNNMMEDNALERSIKMTEENLKDIQNVHERVNSSITDRHTAVAGVLRDAYANIMKNSEDMDADYKNMLRNASEIFGDVGKNSSKPDSAVMKEIDKVSKDLDDLLGSI